MKKSNRIISFIMFLCFITISLPVIAESSSPYDTYVLKKNGKYAPSQEAYEPVKVYTDNIVSPEDIFIAPNGDIYLADSGLNAVTVFSEEGKYKKSIGEGILKIPTGVHVDIEMNVYVADYGNSLVYKFDKDGTLIKEYERPVSPLYGVKETYKPTKVIADLRENVFVISEGSTNGIIQLNDIGEFTGYFGVNETNITFKMLMQRMLFTTAQKSQLLKNRPPSPNNIAIDSEGIIYTATPNNRIKKLNIAGKNIFNSSVHEKAFQDLTVDKNGNVFAIASTGYIFEYDSFGNLIFAFGSDDNYEPRIGLFKQPTGIAVDSYGNLIICDKEYGMLTVLKPTEVADRIHEGVLLYKEGLYVESMQAWQEVLRLNSSFALAHQAMGKAYFKLRQYDKALEEFRMANDFKGYSESYWEIRNEWLQRNLANIILFLILLFIAKKVGNFVDRKKGVYNIFRKARKLISSRKMIKELHYCIHILKHPIDTFYDIKKLRKVTYYGGGILFVWLVIVTIMQSYLKGYIFLRMEKSEINILSIIISVIIPFALWTVSNYMVSTICDGEGYFRDIFIGTLVAFSPILLFAVPITVLSNVLTLNESFVIDFSMQILTIWSLINLFISVKEIHDYTFAETIKNILLTIFGMIIIVIVFFIIYILLGQVVQFVINFR